MIDMEITKEMIAECISDTRIGGGYQKLYEMITDEIENQYSESTFKRIKETLEFYDISADGMTKMEMLYEYSQLI